MVGVLRSLVQCWQNDPHCHQLWAPDQLPCLTMGAGFSLSPLFDLEKPDAFEVRPSPWSPRCPHRRLCWQRAPGDCRCLAGLQPTMEWLLNTSSCSERSHSCAGGVCHLWLHEGECHAHQVQHEGKHGVAWWRCRCPRRPLPPTASPPRGWPQAPPGLAPAGGGGVMRSSSLGSTPKAASVECNYNLLKSNPLLRFPQFVESINGTILDDFTLTKPVNWTAPTAAARETQRTEVRRGRLLLPLCARRHRGAASPHGCVCGGGGGCTGQPTSSVDLEVRSCSSTDPHPPACPPARPPSHVRLLSRSHPRPSAPAST